MIVFTKNPTEATRSSLSKFRKDSTSYQKTNRLTPINCKSINPNTHTLFLLTIDSPEFCLLTIFFNLLAHKFLKVVLCHFENKLLLPPQELKQFLRLPDFQKHFHNLFECFLPHTYKPQMNQLVLNPYWLYFQYLTY